MNGFRTAVCVVGIALWMPLVYLFARDTGITNAVTTAASVVSQTVPPPYSLPLHAVASAILALLAAWQGLTYRKLEVLRAGGGRSAEPQSGAQPVSSFNNPNGSKPSKQIPIL
jgi:hypothetical protein